MKAGIAVFIALLASVSVLMSPFLVCAQDFQYVLGTDYYAPVETSLPKKGLLFTDPDFHTFLVRMTDRTEYEDVGVQNEYAKTDPENCDSTIVVLRGSTGTWYLYDTITFEVKKALGSWFVDGIEPEPRWSATDPKILFYVYETELRAYSLDSDSSTLIHDFSSDFPSAHYITTGSEGNPSLDQRYWSFLVEDSDYTTIAAVIYDKQTDSIVGSRKVLPDKVEDISMDMSGNHCMLGFESHVFQICSRDFSSIRDLSIGANGHNDFALTPDGRDVLVYQNTQNDFICMTDLNTLDETPIIGIPFTVNTDIGLHVSGNCAEKPGWVLVSTYGARKPVEGSSHSWMDTQIFMLQLQRDPIVWRIAHTHSYTSDEATGEKNYFAEAFATINQAGTRVYFGSNWNNLSSDYTDTYQVMLPSGWQMIAGESAVAATSPPAATSSEQGKPPSPLIYAVVLMTVIITLGALALIILKRHTQPRLHYAKKSPSRIVHSGIAFHPPTISIPYI